MGVKTMLTNSTGLSPWEALRIFKCAKWGMRVDSTGQGRGFEAGQSMVVAKDHQCI